jgi:hypothetical protein
MKSWVPQGEIHSFNCGTDEIFCVFASEVRDASRIKVVGAANQ